MVFDGLARISSYVWQRGTDTGIGSNSLGGGSVSGPPNNEPSVAYAHALPFRGGAHMKVPKCTGISGAHMKNERENMKTCIRTCLENERGRTHANSRKRVENPISR